MKRIDELSPHLIRRYMSASALDARDRLAKLDHYGDEPVDKKIKKREKNFRVALKKMNDPKMFECNNIFAALLEDVNLKVLDSVAKLLDIDEEEASKKLSELDMDDMLSLVDAVSKNDDDEIKKIVSDTNEKFNIGDEVIVKEIDHDDKDEDDHNTDGTIKIPDGPNNTVGVLIDGELNMINREDIKPKLKEAVNEDERHRLISKHLKANGFKEINDSKWVHPQTKTEVHRKYNDKGWELSKPEVVCSNGSKHSVFYTKITKDGCTIEEGKKMKSKKLKESVVGLTSIPDIQRMKELAGITSVETQPVGYSGALAPGSFETEIEVKDVPENPVIPAADPCEQIMSALDVIEQNMGELKVSNYKKISDRLVKVQNMIFNESIGHKRKPLSAPPYNNLHYGPHSSQKGGVGGGDVVEVKGGPHVGKEVKIDNWSPGTGDIYARDESGELLKFKARDLGMVWF